MSPRPSNVGWYAVAKDRGRTVLAVGPLDASDAHRAVDTLRPHAPAFADFGVARIVVAPDKPLPGLPAPRTGRGVSDYVRCSRCGRRCSRDVPGELVVRAWIECPECIEGDDTMPVREAARLIGVHENTIRNWCNAGLLRFRTLPGSGYRRVLRRDVLDAAARWAARDTPPPDPPTHAN